MTYIPLTNNLMDLIWLPDAHIHNFRSIKQRSLLNDFELLSVVDKTKMVYIGELEVVIYCPMSFESYPLDSHTCSFEGEFFRAVAGFEIRLQRKFKKYIFYHYIPSTVLALIANVSLTCVFKYVYYESKKNYFGIVIQLMRH